MKTILITLLAVFCFNIATFAQSADPRPALAARAIALRDSAHMKRYPKTQKGLSVAVEILKKGGKQDPDRIEALIWSFEKSAEIALEKKATSDDTAENDNAAATFTALASYFRKGLPQVPASPPEPAVAPVILAPVVPAPAATPPATPAPAPAAAPKAPTVLLTIPAGTKAQ